MAKSLMHTSDCINLEWLFQIMPHKVCQPSSKNVGSSSCHNASLVFEEHLDGLAMVVIHVTQTVVSLLIQQCSSLIL